MKAVIFDMDGTILDTLQDLRGSVNHALKKHGMPERSSKEIRSFLGNGMAVLIHKSVPEGTDEKTEAAVLEEHKAYYPKHCAEKTKPYPGIEELLNFLHEKGIKTAVVSNKRDSNVKTLVKEYFNGLFDVAVGARDNVERKPSADLVRIALDELGVSEDEAVYVGDSDVDVATAKAAKLKMIAVTWGFRDMKDLTQAGAEIFADDTEELKDLLLKEDPVYKAMIKKVMIKIRVMFAARILLWLIALISTIYWISYSFELYKQEIFDPHDYATLLRPVLYICLAIAFVSICISFVLHARTKKLKKEHGIK